MKNNISVKKSLILTILIVCILIVFIAASYSAYLKQILMV